MRFIFLSFFILSACGVKAPPVAIQRPAETESQQLNCSVYDPQCDRKDPKYDATKDPAKQHPAPENDE